MSVTDRGRTRAAGEVRGRWGRGLRAIPLRRPRDARGRPRRRLRARTRLILAVSLILLLALLGGGWLWLQDSPLVAVQRVQVSGLDGADAGQIRTALVTAARGMTTLDVRMSTLRAAVSPYPVVKDLRVSTQFPHGMRIRVIEQVPVAVVMLGGRAVPVAADGTLLHDVTPSGRLPAVSVGAAPGGARITEGSTLTQLQVLAAAPARFLAKVSGVSRTYWHGVVVQLRQGPSLYFGDGTGLQFKWQAVTDVLASAQSEGAGYIDVTDPQRPAAGVGGAATATGVGSGSASASASSASASASSATAATTGATNPGIAGSPTGG